MHEIKNEVIRILCFGLQRVGEISVDDWLVLPFHFEDVLVKVEVSTVASKRLAAS